MPNFYAESNYFSQFSSVIINNLHAKKFDSNFTRLARSFVSLAHDEGVMHFSINPKVFLLHFRTIIEGFYTKHLSRTSLVRNLSFDSLVMMM